MSTKENESYSSKDKNPFESLEIIDDGSMTNLELLLDLCPYAMVIASVDGTILGLNANFASIFQQSKKELMRKSGYALLELGAGERRRQIVNNIIHEKKPYSFEDYERGLWWRTTFLPIMDTTGNVTKLVAIIKNIQMEKKREREITEQNEEFWRRLIKYSNNIFLIADEKSVIRYINESVHLILGYTAKELIGKKVFDFMYEADKEKGKAFHSKVLTEQSPLVLLHRIIDKKGSIRFMRTTVNNLLDNPIIKGIVITSQDVTKTHKIEIETKEMKEYLQRTIDSVSELVFCLTSKGKVLLWNDQIVQLTGFSDRSMIGKNLFANSIVEDKESFKTYLETCVRKLTKPYDLKIRTKHDEYRLIRIQGSVVKTDNETDRSIVFTGKDITYDTEIHGSLITGSSYLIPETSNEKAMQLLNGLLREDYAGLIITRDDIEDDLFDNIGKNSSLTTYYFSKADTVSPDHHSIPDPETLITDVSGFLSTHERGIVLIDRLDFLIALYGFKTVMQAIYSISSSATRENGIVLIRLNPDIVSPFELTILSEELKRLPEQNIERITLDNELYEILQYTNEKNQNKILVSYKNISTQFSITKVTTAKRITSLSNKGLVITKKKGRLKTIHITTKGKNLLQRRPVI